ncbi:MAG: PLP-dependent aminotransferase family protein [Proteobacteria bacterium]|nr:PLP-dependent aminotransferase family protein [Pseudomonadota bacterium]
MEFQYIALANELEQKIENGEYKAGDKLPSIRNLHTLTGLSLSTVYSAFIELEKRGVVQAREKSGFFIKPSLDNILPLPKMVSPPVRPQKVSVNALVEFIVEAGGDPAMLPFGTAMAAIELLPLKQISRVMRTVLSRYLRTSEIHYGPPAGIPVLRQQISKRLIGLTSKNDESEILITSGCMDAIQLCLRAVAKPGDTILVESPTFVCYLQLIEDLNMYALEVSADPVHGIDLNAVKKAIDQNKVNACILSPNFQNPLGFEMPEPAKKELVEMMAKKKIPIIEDDIYGDLYFGDTRPKTLKSYDQNGMVLYCASFSKTLAPDLRIGFTLPGKFKDQVKRLKINSVMTTSKLNQFIIAEFLKQGLYDRHLRKLRQAVKIQMANTARAVAQYFPPNTYITAPKGGLVLWVQLDKKIDGIKLFEEAIKEKIFITPGDICSGTGKYGNCIRISCGHPWNDKMEKGIAKLGKIIEMFLSHPRI